MTAYDTIDSPIGELLLTAERGALTRLYMSPFDLDVGADRDETAAALLALPGIGPWTADYVRMRALGDPDVLLTTDLGVRRGLERLGAPGDPRSAATRGESWAPWRSYALIHLWHLVTDREITL